MQNYYHSVSGQILNWKVSFLFPLPCHPLHKQSKLMPHSLRYWHIRRKQKKKRCKQIKSPLGLHYQWYYTASKRLGRSRPMGTQLCGTLLPPPPSHPGALMLPSWSSRRRDEDTAKTTLSSTVCNVFRKHGDYSSQFAENRHFQNCIMPLSRKGQASSEESYKAPSRP